jgi:hypothetical protein
MRNVNKFLIVAIVGGAGFATIGSGAGAAFVDSPSAHQTINTGTLLIGLSDGSGGHSASGTTTTPAALTLSDVGPTSSSFKNTADITATNNGTVSGTISDIELATTGDVSPLATDMQMAVYDQDYSTQLCTGTVAHCTGVNLATKATPASELTLAPGAKYTIHVETYAGGSYAGAPASLSNADEGRTLHESLTYTVNG